MDREGLNKVLNQLGKDYNFSPIQMMGVADLVVKLNEQDPTYSTPYKNGHPRFYQILEDVGRLHDQKNTDYAQGSIQGPLGNFHRAAQFKQMYPNFPWHTAFGTAIDYMLKQLDAAMILASTGRESITGEPIPTRLQDVVVYGVIAMILWEESQSLSAGQSECAGDMNLVSDNNDRMVPDYLVGDKVETFR